MYEDFMWDLSSASSMSVRCFGWDEVLFWCLFFCFSFCLADSGFLCFSLSRRLGHVSCMSVCLSVCLSARLHFWRCRRPYLSPSPCLCFCHSIYDYSSSSTPYFTPCSELIYYSSPLPTIQSPYISVPYSSPITLSTSSYSTL